MTTRDPSRHCPSCGERGGLEYQKRYAAQLSFTENDERHTHNLGTVKDFSCRNCDAEFVLISEEES